MSDVGPGLYCTADCDKVLASLARLPKSMARDAEIDSVLDVRLFLMDRRHTIHKGGDKNGKAQKVGVQNKQGE